MVFFFVFVFSINLFTFTEQTASKWKTFNLTRFFFSGEYPNYTFHYLLFFFFREILSLFPCTHSIRALGMENASTTPLPFHWKLLWNATFLISGEARAPMASRNSMASRGQVFLLMRSVPKVMSSISFCWPMMSETDGGMAVRVEPFYQYSVTCWCCVRDHSRGAGWQNGNWNGSAFEIMVCHWVPPCGKKWRS